MKWLLFENIDVFNHIMSNLKDYKCISSTELNLVMEGEPLYTTTLRSPPDQLRSMFSYFDLSHKLGKFQTNSIIINHS